MDIFYPIQLLANFITYNLLFLQQETHLANAINFFIYDVIKIIILLLLITQVMSFINVVFPVEKIRNFLHTKKLYWLEYFLASFFGAITPFCSCSSIPLFIWFLKWGIPLWITFSFLITSPLVNEVAIAMFLWIFWLKITLIYMLSWIFLWMLWGFILWKMKLEKYVADFIWNIKINETKSEEIKKTWKIIWKESSKEWFDITKKVLPYVILWVWIWAMIHSFIPTWFFENYISKDNPFAVPIAVIFGIPMYANATSVIPVIQALIVKWVPLGTWLAFMMAVIGLSLPEFLILKKVMKIQLLLIFFGLVWFFIIILWYFFNIVL
jgi:uncharacterized protein